MYNVISTARLLKDLRNEYIYYQKKIHFESSEYSVTLWSFLHSEFFKIKVQVFTRCEKQTFIIVCLALIVWLAAIMLEPQYFYSTNQ